MTDDQQAQLIENLCDQWITAAVKGDTTSVGRHTDGLHLTANGIEFPNLGFNSLRAAARGLARTVFPRGSAYIAADHHLFWAWAGELFFGKRSAFLSPEEFRIKELAQETFAHALIAPGATDMVRMLAYPSASLQHHLAFDILKNSFSRLPFLAFPLLEGLLKRSCSAYVDTSGKVLQPWKVPGKASYKPKSRCNSIEHLLWKVGDIKGQELKNDIDVVLNVLAQVEQVQDGYRALYEWRNKSLHGERSHETIAGVLLSLIVIICIHEAGAVRFEDLRERARRDTANEEKALREHGIRHGLCLYPPA